jgi:hypothetical protein
MVETGTTGATAIARVRRTIGSLALLSLTAYFSGCRGPAPSPRSTVPPATSSAPTPASEQAASNEQAPPLLPDPERTPGATLDVTTDDICVPGYTQQVRDVPVEVKREVYAEYGITHRQPGEYEVDHLISLELGGSNSIKNLWPQSYETEPWNAHVKDELEDELHRLVCSGQLDLKTAQHDITTDWISAYKKYFNTDVPLSGRAHRRRRRAAAEGRPSSREPSALQANPEGSPNGQAPAGEQVWVNTRSGKYFLPGSRYYGQTKQGEYMSGADARRLGYTPARGE